MHIRTDQSQQSQLIFNTKDDKFETEFWLKQKILASEWLNLNNQTTFIRAEKVFQ